MPQALLFDLDGTLTEPMLDFVQIRADMGLPIGAPILETIATLEHARRIECERILGRHEARAAADSKLSVGCRDLFDRVREVRPRLHVFGHIHEAAGRLDIDGTTFVNASSFQGRGGPFVVEW